MLEHLGQPAAGEMVMAAMARVLAADGPRTRDLGGTARTEEVADAVIAALA
jgi:isocitrate/isopropylmalate dehydrogenase